MSQHDGNIHVIPTGPGNPEHLESEGCWCQPELVADYSVDGGRKAYLHREVQ